jgi:prevent-host-death family protein
MQRMSAREAKNGFGRLIDIARAEPVAIEKHGRIVVVVIAVEEYERLARKQASTSSDDLIQTADGPVRP